jgi:hypothetical protein
MIVNPVIAWLNFAVVASMLACPIHVSVVSCCASTEEPGLESQLTQLFTLIEFNYSNKTVCTAHLPAQANARTDNQSFLAPLLVTPAPL